MNMPSGIELDRTLTAIADPTRRAILARLAHGGARVTEIAERFDVSLNAISKHLKVLERAGLVRREIHGREHRLSFNAAPLESADEWIATMRRVWEDRLDALERFLREKKSAPDPNHGKRGAK
jgi:DNA-binding transcriptional ArsR family regulator